MNVSEQVIAVLNAACEKFGVAFDWTQENVLPYLQELCARFVRYEVVTSIAWCVLLLSMTLVVYCVTKKFHKLAKDSRYDPDETETICAIICWVALCILSIITVVAIFVQVFDTIECVTIPEKVIIGYLKSL